jgi:hypothetical protein
VIVLVIDDWLGEDGLEKGRCGRIGGGRNESSSIAFNGFGVVKNESPRSDVMSSWGFQVQPERSGMSYGSVVVDWVGCHWYWRAEL